MKIGIDVESGENSYHELIDGVLKASGLFPEISLFLFGNINNVKKNFPHINSFPNIFLVHAKDIITMQEAPISALKKKKDATVNIGARMLKNKTIDVFFSPGNTGATVAASVLTLGCFPGIKKPAMAVFFPRILEGETLILDIGANPNCTEENLFHNALLGQSFYRIMTGKQDPSIGLLNMGTEFGKGKYYLKKTYHYLKQLPLFKGNVEGYDILRGGVDVVVCDGFTGNSILKIAEASKEYFVTKTASRLQRLKKKFLLGFLIKFLEKKIFDQEQNNRLFLPQYFGAAPLLGVNGTVLVGHGRCGQNDLINAIYLSTKLQELNCLAELKFQLKEKIR